MERDIKPLPPVDRPFGTPIDWGQDQVLALHQVADNDMLAIEQRVVRRPRVRVVDT